MIRTATVAEAATARSLRSASFLDVRTADEFAQGHIDVAAFMPLHVVPLRVSELSRSESYFVICQSGADRAFSCVDRGGDRVRRVTDPFLPRSRPQHAR